MFKEVNEAYILQMLPDDEGWFLGMYNMSSESKTAVASQTMCGRCKDPHNNI